MKIQQIFIVILLFAMALPAQSQDKIYRKNGDVIRATGVTTFGGSRSYTIPGDAEGVIRHISTSLIDSIVYENGKKEVFLQDTVIPESLHTEDIPFRKHALGTDVYTLSVYRYLRFSYEYLPGNGSWGIYLAGGSGFNPQVYYYYGSADYQMEPFHKYAKWDGRAGVNKYIFKPGFFRMSAGMHYFTGTYSEYDSYDDWEVNDQVGEIVSLHGLLFSFMFYIRPDDFYQVSLGTDSPLMMSRGFSTNFKLEISLTF